MQMTSTTPMYSTTRLLHLRTYGYRTSLPQEERRNSITRAVNALDATAVINRLQDITSKSNNPIMKEDLDWLLSTNNISKQSLSKSSLNSSSISSSTSLHKNDPDYDPCYDESDADSYSENDTESDANNTSCDSTEDPESVASTCDYIQPSSRQNKEYLYEDMFNASNEFMRTVSNILNEQNIPYNILAGSSVTLTYIAKELTRKCRLIEEKLNTMKK